MQAEKILLEEPSANDIRFLEDRLYEFNQAATGIDDGRALGVFVRDDRGDIVAAATGHTWGGTCELLQVWIAEVRGGARRSPDRLIAAAEAEADRRGCSQLVLMTHSFRAPDFYRKLGFELVSQLPDYPQAHAHLLLRKALG